MVCPRYRLGEALRDIEREYGLRVLARADRTAAKSLTRAEMERSAHSGREPDRAVLYRHVQAAAAAARSEEEFLAALEARGVLVRLRHSAVRPGEVTGYAVALDHGPDRARSGSAAGSSRPTSPCPSCGAGGPGRA